MRDGKTQRLDRPGDASTVEAFLGRHDVRLVVVQGDEAGSVHRFRRERHVLGRGPGVDLTVDDPAMSRQHAAFEYAAGGYRVRDLGSTNGLRHNGRPAQVADLAHGDLLEIGSQVFQVLVEVRSEEPEVYELDPEA